MDFLLRAGTLICQRWDCPKDIAPGHPCSRCMMPFVDRDIRALINLYRRCRDRRCLPESGGVMDQPEVLMAAFDAIDNVVAEHQRRSREEQEQELRAQRLARELNA